jgi:hypothetical protein
MRQQMVKEHQDASDGAVGVYPARNEDASEKVARRAVEKGLFGPP